MMKSIESVIEAWKAVRIPILEGEGICFEKDCNFTEVKEIPDGVAINVVIRDRFARRNGIPHGKSFVAVFIAHYQGVADETLKAIETKQFELFLQGFTKEVVESRRKELVDAMASGYRVDFAEF